MHCISVLIMSSYVDDIQNIVKFFQVLTFAFSVSIIDPLSEGLVTPLGVEKLSPRFRFFDNMFSCIT